MISRANRSKWIMGKNKARKSKSSLEKSGRHRKMPRLLTAIDLFAGAGGFSVAALACSFDIRAAVEHDPHACNTYKNNLVDKKTGRPALFDSDIQELDWEDVLNKAGLKRGECDLLLGGPPCQGFSAHRINGAGVDDPRNELLASYFDSVEAIRPAVFLIENVPGLLWERHEQYLVRLLAAAETARYRVLPAITVNARSYGVPQSRKRIFLLGFREDVEVELVWPPAPSHHDPNEEGAAAKGKPRWKTASTVFSEPVGRTDVNDVHMQHSEALTAVFASTPINGGSRHESYRVLDCHKTHNGHKDVYGRIDPSKPGPTMTTACINPSKGRFLHPTQNHGITLRHAARFQTFPDEFVFSGGIIAAGRQIGNAVPVDLGIALLEPIRDALLAIRNKQSGDKRHGD